MSELRIFSHLPNPQGWKTRIAARVSGVMALRLQAGLVADWLGLTRFV
jgi:hypothetical protein